MVSGYEEHMGTPMDVINHPARTNHAATLKYAGDVLQGPWPKDNPPRLTRGAASQGEHGIMRLGGPKNVDPSNIYPHPTLIDPRDK